MNRRIYIYLFVLLLLANLAYQLYKFLDTVPPAENLPSPTPEVVVELPSPSPTPIESPEPSILPEPSPEILAPPPKQTGKVKKEAIENLLPDLKGKVLNQSKVKLKPAASASDLLKGAIPLKLRGNAVDDTVTFVGLWRGQIQIKKGVGYELVINRPWDFMVDEYIASSCAGIEEGEYKIFQEALYNKKLFFFERQANINGETVNSVLVQIGEKYLLDISLPLSEEDNNVRGFAYLRRGKEVKLLGSIVLHRDNDYPKSDCTDFEHNEPVNF